MPKFWKKKGSQNTLYTKQYPDKLIYQRLFSYLKPYKNDIKVLIFLVVLSSITQIAYPVGMTWVLDAVQNDDMRKLMIIAVALFGIFIINFFTKRAYQYNINKLGQYVLYDIRYDLFTHIQDLSLEFYSEIPAGKLMSRLTNDVANIQNLIANMLIQLIGDILTVVVSFFTMLYWAWQLTFIILLFVPLFAGIFIYFGKKSRYYWIEQRKTISEITRILQEAVSGSRTIKAFVTEDQNIETFDVANKADREVSYSAAKLSAFLQPITQIIVALGIGIVVFAGRWLLESGVLNVSVLMGYVVMATQFLNPFNNIGNFYNNSQSALAAGDRILLILDTKPTVIESPNAITLPPVQGEIQYDNVGFEYVKDIPVLKDVSFITKKNQRYAFVGFTGAGKSTLISLLSRFYDPTSGRILVDGVDIRDVTLESLRSQMGIVLQDTFLFSGSVMDNIRYGKLDASDDEVVQAATRVGAHKFIMALPDGYQTDVRERGGLLSIGQRQLISFARALLANPPVLILDEATSSVDPYTELRIQEALEVLLNDRNSFIIAHRLSTILNSDVICVMENGQIIQRGTHDELVAEGGLYKHLYEMQFKKMEDKQGLDSKLS